MPINEFCPQIGKAEILSVLETLEDNWVTEGKKTKQLEGMLADYFGCKRVVMVPNGTLALFAALKVLGIGPGDEVIVPDFTFFASASAVVLTGAKPVLVDVDELDGNISVAAARASLSDRTKAIMPVHIYGQSCDMQAVMELARCHGLLVVEDAAQGMGVTFGDKHVGTFGDIGCMSFFADKTLTTGEGGALLVNDEELARRCVYFKNQGRLRRGTFVHEHMGYNFRITDLQAAIGVAQFERIAQTIRHKRSLCAAYARRLSGCPGVRWPADNGFGQAVPFRVNILVDDPEGLARFLADRDIAVRRFFYPLHLQPSLNAANCVVRQQPVNSVRLFEAGLMLPSGLDLAETEVDYVCACILEYQRAHAADARGAGTRDASSRLSRAVCRSL
ncbi:MAG: DegT/DnrJ/EryC1/StrS family aminotransferase [Phycisphaerales bacterium]|nr:MAG: DegT/DnrJ/EryC1/StrS family aminotransferase [Phycisphaerales bacterium]